MSDPIDRAEAIQAITSQEVVDKSVAKRILMQLPSAEPEIIYCKDCRKHNQGINEAPYLADRCPLILHRGYAHGHEFDYQYCAYADRRTDEI